MSFKRYAPKVKPYIRAIQYDGSQEVRDLLAEHLNIPNSGRTVVYYSKIKDKLIVRTDSGSFADVEIGNYIALYENSAVVHVLTESEINENYQEMAQ